MAKFVTAAEAVQQIKDGSMLATSGFVGGLLAEAVLKEIQASFKANGTPKDLSIVYAAGQGDSGERGLNHLGEEGLMKRIIGGHFNLSPRLGELINNNKVEATTCRRVRFPNGSAISRAAVPARLPKSAPYLR